MYLQQQQVDREALAVLQAECTQAKQDLVVAAIAQEQREHMDAQALLQREEEQVCDGKGKENEALHVFIN